MIFIIAGTKKQADQFAEIQGWPREEYRYAILPSDIMGARWNDIFLKVGTWYERADIEDIWNAVQSIRAKRPAPREPLKNLSIKPNRWEVFSRWFKYPAFILILIALVFLGFWIDGKYFEFKAQRYATNNPTAPAAMITEEELFEVLKDCDR